MIGYTSGTARPGRIRRHISARAPWPLRPHPLERNPVAGFTVVLDLAKREPETGPKRRSCKVCASIYETELHFPRNMRVERLRTSWGRLPGALRNRANLAQPQFGAKSSARFYKIVHTRKTRPASAHQGREFRGAGPHRPAPRLRKPAREPLRPAPRYARLGSWATASPRTCPRQAPTSSFAQNGRSRGRSGTISSATTCSVYV